MPPAPSRGRARRPGERPIRGLGALALTLLLALAAVPSAAQEPPEPPEPSAPESPLSTVAPLPPAAASIVVDVDTGEVISASNARSPMLPASTTKILTALLVRQNLDLDADITVSKTASIAEPRRIGLVAGSRWRVEDLLYAAMLCSCNDAAWALGQAAGGGTMAGFEGAVAELTEQLGMEDDPVVRDPAGFDDERSVRGGNRLSARDLAIASRAFLADPELASIASTPRHDWVGGDGQPHYVNNLNRFLDLYEGAIGLKTGTTTAAGSIFVAAAERDGRTLVSVVVQSADKYAESAALLDAGFLLAAVGETTGDVLPAVPAELGGVPPTTGSPTTTAPVGSQPVDVPTPSSPSPAPGDQEVAAPVAAPGPASTNDGSPVDPVWLGGGAFVLLAGGGVAGLAVRRRRGAAEADRRPARPRRRDRRRRASRATSTR
ncbi:MAG: D-alanyl-D-alanine carboxypeptidase family protein [Iamia sp.]